MNVSLIMLAPLPRMIVALARRQALEGSARRAWVCASCACVASCLVARYAPGVPRVAVLGVVIPALLPVVFAGRRASRAPLPFVVEIDRRLGAQAAVITAAELALGGLSAPPGFREKILADARAALDGRSSRDVVTPLSSRTRAHFAACVLVLVAGVVAPIRPVAHARRAPVSVTHDAPAASAAREAAESLVMAAQRDPDHAPQIAAVADAARALAHDLEVGVAREDALARADELDRSADEALSWARDPRRQAAVDAALAELTDPSTAALRDALAQGDLARVDEAVRALAEAREESSRQRARSSLARAAAAARNAGATDLARALDEEEDLLRRRSAANAFARAVAEALGDTPGARRIAEHLARDDRDAELSRALDEVMREMDGALTPEERRRIAEAMARLAAQSDPGSRADLERAARATSPEEARAAMRAMLEAMRRGSLDRTRAGEAARAGGAARGDLARLRVGLQTGRTPGRAQSASGAASGGGAPGRGGDGNGHDEGHVATTGSTRAIAQQGFVAPTRGAADPRNPGVPVSVEHVDTTGAQATTPDESRIREAAPSALHGIERTPVPEPYRRQVRVYFGS